MTNSTAPRARRVAVPTEVPPAALQSYDYVDAFEVETVESDPRSAEEFARAALEQAPLLMRWTMLTAWRGVLGFRLGPLSSPDHVLGWEVAESRPEVVRLALQSPVLNAAVVGRKLAPGRVIVTTFVGYVRPAPARVLWSITSPLHRLFAPRLIERAATAVTHEGGGTREAAQLRA